MTSLLIIDWLTGIASKNCWQKPRKRISSLSLQLEGTWTMRHSSNLWWKHLPDIQWNRYLRACKGAWVRLASTFLCFRCREWTRPPTALKTITLGSVVIKAPIWLVCPESQVVLPKSTAISVLQALKSKSKKSTRGEGSSPLLELPTPTQAILATSRCKTSWATTAELRCRGMIRRHSLCCLRTTQQLTTLCCRCHRRSQTIIRT